MVFEGQQQEVLAELVKSKQTVSKFEEFVPSLREYLPVALRTLSGWWTKRFH